MIIRKFKDVLNCYTIAYKSQAYTSVSSDPIGICLCNQHNIIDYYSNPNPIVVYPGQSFNISLIAVGYCGGSSPGTYIVISSSPNLQLIRNADNDKTSIQCFVYKAIQLLSNVSQGTATISVSSTPYPFSKSLTLKIQFLNQV